MTERNRQDKLRRITDLMAELPVNLPPDTPAEFPEYELTMTQFKAMTLLQRGPQRMGDISRQLDISLSSVTNLVGRLESKGLVQRVHDTSDRRVVTCELTEEGLQAVTWIWKIGQDRLIWIASRLDDDELDRVVDAFEILVNAAIREQQSGSTTE